MIFLIRGGVRVNSLWRGSEATRASEWCSSGLFTCNLTAVCERIRIHQHSTLQHLQLAGAGGECASVGAVFVQLSRTLAFNLHKEASESHFKSLTMRTLSRDKIWEVEIAIIVFMKMCFMPHCVSIRGPFKQHVYQHFPSKSLYERSVSCS